MASGNKKPDITMFFPAYNEVENIPLLLSTAKKVLRKHAGRWEILVVVYEGSSDGTIALVKKWERKDRRIRLVLQPRDRKGVGYAKKMGFGTAKYPYIFYADSDNQFDLGEFSKFAPFIGKYDVIAGYRIKRQDPKMRIIVSKVYNIMMRTLMGARERDLDCAFRLVSRRVLDSIKLNCSTGLATTELLVKARKKGFSIKEIGVHHYPRRFGQPVFEVQGGLNLPKPRVVWDILREVFRLWGELRFKG